MKVKVSELKELGIIGQVEYQEDDQGCLVYIKDLETSTFRQRKNNEKTCYRLNIAYIHPSRYCIDRDEINSMWKDIFDYDQYVDKDLVLKMLGL
jgi:hypothetical protein